VEHKRRYFERCFYFVHLSNFRESKKGLEQHEGEHILDELVLFLCRNNNKKAICSATVTLFEHWLNP